MPLCCLVLYILLNLVNKSRLRTFSVFVVRPQKAMHVGSVPVRLPRLSPMRDRLAPPADTRPFLSRHHCRCCRVRWCPCPVCSVLDAVGQLEEYKEALLYGSASLGLTGSILVRGGVGCSGWSAHLLAAPSGTRLTVSRVSSQALRAPPFSGGRRA